MTTYVTDQAREVLLAARADGNKLYLPPGRLPPEVYQQVDRVLREAGGRWKGGKTQAHVFEGAAAPTLAQILQAERFVSTKETEQWFESPEWLAERLVQAALLTPGMEVLEPSAGRGAIARQVAAAGCSVDCVEVNGERAQVIIDGGYARKVTVGDFLAQPPVPDSYDAVVMNPPFAGHADEHHVLHALRMLRPGGVLVSLMGAGIRFREDKGARLIRNLADGAIDDVPKDAFKSVGAEMSTCIVVIRTGGGRFSGAPRRVSLHGEDPVLPRFVPGTAPRGAYEAQEVGTGRWRRFRFYGDCLGCGGRCWNWVDEIGVTFGDHSWLPFTANEFTRRQQDDMDAAAWNVEFAECLGCKNNAIRHRRAVAAAWASLQPPVDDHGAETLF
jgi:SAM-dependent methyltransferase